MCVSESEPIEIYITLLIVICDSLRDSFMSFAYQWI